MLKAIVENVTGLTRIDSLVDKAENSSGTGSIFTDVVEARGITDTVSREDLGRIPLDGPLIVVANHPCGFSEGLIIPGLIDKVRGDQKTLAHTYFDRWPSLAERMILLDPAGGSDGRSGKMDAMKAAVRWVRGGNALVMFPAGEVAHARRFSFRAEEGPWKPGLAHLIRLTKATVLPVHVEARNSRIFDFLSWIHPRLGVMALGREFLAQRGRRFRVNIGSPLEWKEFSGLSDPAEILAKCRQAVSAAGDKCASCRNGSPAEVSPAPGYGQVPAVGDSIVS